MGWLIGMVLAWSWTECMQRRITGFICIHDDPNAKYSVWLLGAY